MYGTGADGKPLPRNPEHFQPKLPQPVEDETNIERGRE